MKVLIIGTPRSGTSTLNRAIGTSANLKRYGEPWNRNLHSNILPFPYEFESKCVVKTLVNQIPYGYDNFPIHDFYSELLKLFDKVILLGRKSREDLLISFTYQMQSDIADPTRVSTDWHTKYQPDIPALDLETYRSDINYICDLLLDVSKYFNLPITWYEDLYSGNLDFTEKFIDSLELSLDKKTFYKWMNPKRKLRVDSKSII